MSLYLKYRPKDFESLVGQEFIKTTLKKAVQQEKTVGAYLLCGPRGTGKTSTARILTKAINCLDPKNGNPCNKCNICESINNESLVDVIEIDAASHTGVDNIRELISKSQFTPTHAKFKVYIIDEVHMLSTGAFNALLKTLEEPPSYLKFILATTETHKVPETIISRCQRYDFKNINKNDIKSRLEFIAKSEKIKIDEKSLDYISTSASGGLRNAISLFEQLTKDSEINYENIVNTLGIVDNDILEEFLEKLLNKNNDIISDFENIISSGKNIKLFFKQLIFFIKNKAIENLGSNDNISEYINILETLDNTYSKTKNSLDENTTFLIGILKIINPEKKSPIIPFNKGDENNKIEQINKKRVTEIKNLEKKEKHEEIKTEDIDDVFGDNSADIEKKESSGNIEFDKNLFINKSKENGINSAGKLSLVGAMFRLSETELIIHFKNEFTKKSINTPDNISILNKTLEEIGIKGIKIILK